MRFFFSLIFIFFSMHVMGKPTAPQFAEKEISINDKKIRVEIADSPEKTSYGLMYRSKLPEDRGMLFIFPDESTRFFWMKNTFIPLSIGFFNAKKVLVDIQDMEPVTSEMVTSPPQYKSRQPAKYCLEVNRGWFKRNRIKIGDRFDFTK